MQVVLQINYCNALQKGLPTLLVQKVVQKLQQVQSTVAGLVSGTSKYDHISSFLAHLHWLSVSFWARFKVYKALNSLGPCYLA